MSNVQDALRAREERKKKEQEELQKKIEAKNSKVDAALDSYKSRKQSNAQSSVADLSQRINSEINKASKISTPSWGSEFKSTLDSTRESRVNISKLTREVESYKNYLDEDTYNSFITALNQLSDGYTSVVNMAELRSQFQNEDEYNSWYESYKKTEEEKNAILGADDFEEYTKQGTALGDKWEFDFFESSPVGNSGYKNDVVGWRNTYKNNTMSGNLDAHKKANFALAMTEDEVNIYSYYLAKYGEDRAKEYLKSIEETVNKREAQRLYEINKGNKLGNLAFSSVAGVDQFFSGVKNIDNLIMGTEADATSALQYTSSMLREDLDGGWGLAYDMVNTISNQLPSILVGTVTGGLGGALTLGASATGNAYSEMRRLGYDEWQSRGYAVLVGASETALQYVLGGISPMGSAKGGVVEKLASSILNKVDNGLARFAIKWGSSMIDEGIEEAAQSILEPILKSAFTGEEIEIDWGEVAYSGLLGALTAGILEGPSTAVGEVATKKAGENLKQDKSAVERLTKLGSTMSADSVAHRLAGKIDENTGAYTVGRLLEEVGASLSEKNMSDIVLSLERKGVTTEDAQKIAKWLNKAVEGKHFNKKQRDILENNEIVSKTFKDIIFNENSTVWQRTIGYNELSKIASTDVSPTKDSAQKVAEVSATNAPTATENATESKSAVSESGKTTYNGNEVSIKDISAVENGKVMLLLDNGETVNARDVEFGNEEEGLLYEAVADMDTDKARDFIQGFTAMKNAPLATMAAPQAGVATYTYGFNEAYTYGRYGIPTEVLERDGKFSQDINPEQKRIAYNRGKIDAITFAKATQEKVDKAVENAKPNKSKANGKVIYEKGIRGTLSEGSKEADSLKLVEFFNTHFAHANVRIYASYTDKQGRRVFKDTDGKIKPAPNGMYMPDGSMALDLNSGENGEGLILYSYSHELTHMAKRLSPVKYKAYADFLFKHYGENRSVEALIAYEISEAASKGRKLSREQAYDEAVARASERMLVDVLNGTAQSKLTELNTKHHDIFEKIKEFFAKLVENIKNWYNDTPSWSDSANIVHEMKDVAEQLQAMWLDMVADAGRVNSALGGNTKSLFTAATEVVKADAKPISSDEIITDGAVVTDGEGKLYSIRSMKHDISNGQMFRDLMTHCGFTKEQVGVLRGQLEDLVEYMNPYRDIVDLNETYGREGRRYSPYKPNSDPLYTISLDFSTQCSKRLLTQYVIEQLQLRENRPMSPEEQMAIRDMLKEYGKVEKGLQVACVMCYVEAARLKAPKQIQKWLDDPTTAMRNYFADKNPEFSAYIKKAQEDFKESRGYPRNASKKEMREMNKASGAKDVTALNKIRPKVRAEYKPSAEEMAIIETASKLPNSTYLTAGNLADLSETHPEIYKAYTAFIRTATRSKALETDEPYYYGDSTRDNGNGIIVSDSFIEAVNRENGMRFSSWSDWRIQHLLDWITAVIDNSVRGAAMHGYTKYGDEVRVLGKTGMMFNLSGVAGTQTGLNEDGSLNFSDTESIDIDEAIALREEFPETAGLQCIGVGIDHIFALLRSDIIDYVIPYHTSGLNATLRRMGDIYGWKDFTQTQHATEDKSIKKEDAVDPEHWHQEPVFSEFFVGYDTKLNGVEAMRKSAENYKRMCKERGLVPKFNEFAKEPNYWKLLIDRKMVNQQTNTLIRQRAVTPDFDFGVIKGIVDKYVKNYDSGLEQRAFNHIVENWDNIPKRIRDLKKQGGTKAKTTKKAIDKLANEPIAVQPNDGILRSDRNNVSINASEDSAIMASDFVTHMNDLVTKRGEWYTEDVFKYVEERPELNFIDRIYEKDAQVKKDLEAFLNTISDVKVLHYLSWYMGEAYGDKNRTWDGWDSKASFPYRGAVRTFRNAVKKRINAVITEKVGGTNLGVKNGDASLADIKDMFYRLNSNEEIGKFAEKVFDTAERLGVNIRFVNQTFSKKKVAGDNLGDMVEYKTSYFNDTAYSDQAKAKTILHELLHACTMYVLVANKYRMFDVTYLGKSKNYENISNAATRLNRIYEEIKNDPAFAGKYGIKNVNEMVAELANEDFVGLLKEKNLWDKIVEWICKLFGVNRGTSAYENARLCVDYILDNPEVSEYKEYARNARSGARRDGYDVFGSTVSEDGGVMYSDRVLMGSLFSGGGTLEAGLAYQMLDKQFGVEYDGKIASVYADNHGDHVQVGRVEDFDISKYDDIFYLHASPVCHNFSKAKHGAKELQMDIDSAKATAKHLETAMPQVFTVENAPGYRKSQSLKIITDKLTELGYKWDVDVYNSADYGSATSRNRVILRAVKDGELPAKPTKQDRTNSWDKVTRDLWDTLPKSYLRPSFISAIENTPKLPILDANGKVNVNKPLLILTTTNGHQVTYCWEGEICPTLTTKCGEAKLVMPDGNIYAVTPEFMGRIQGLPDDYKYPKEKTRAFTIIGNGIPTHLTKAVVGGVLDSAYEQTHDGQVLYSDRKIQPITEAEYKDIEKHFGTTGNFRVAGYLLTDGKLLDFSGKHWGDTTSRSRQVDHRDVQEVLGRGNNGINDMVDMIGNGNIRLMPETGGINLAVYPNEKQRRVLNIYIKQMLATEGQVIVDYDEVGGDTVYSRVYEKYASSSQILSDIRNYFNGARQSDLMQFHTMYSDRSSNSVSNRSLLANALEGVAQNDVERNKLNEYKGKIALIESEQAKLAEVRAKIKELSFATGRRDAKAIKSLQFEANQIANRINTYDRQLLNLESTKALKGVLEREKQMAYKRAEQKGKEALARQREKDAKTQRELLTRYQESRKKGIEGRHKTEMRHKIKDVVNELNQYLLKGTKDKHVPIELQKAVAEALDAVNMDTVGAEERIAKKREEMMRAKSPEVIEKLAKEIEHIQEMGGNMEAKLSRLKTAYDSIINSDDPLIANSHDEVISNTIAKVIEVVGDTPLRDMSLYQLEAVYDMYRMVLHSIRSANKVFKAEKGKEISVLANTVISDLDGKKRNPLNPADTNFAWNNLKPVYAFERLGSPTFIKLFNAVRAGEDVWARDMSEANAFREEQSKKYKFDSWDFEKKYPFTTQRGTPFELDLGEMLSIYAFAKDAHSKGHLIGEGFVFDPKKEVVEVVKGKIKVKVNLEDATAYNLSEQIVADIISKLTPEQKAFADAMQDYLSTTMGEKGNEVSLELYQVKLFKNKNYFPLKVAPQYMAVAKEKAQGEVKIKNKGFTKDRKEGAQNPIVLSSFMDVWANHVNEMSMYHAFTLPLEDFYRVFNYKTPRMDGYAPMSVNASIQNAFGEAATSYIEQLLKDLNGGARSDPRETLGKAMMSNFKKASVMASLSVVIQQPSAIIRAQALVDAKYFVGKKATKGKHKEVWAEVKKYAPVAVIKEMGYFDTGMGKSSVEWLKGEKTWKDKVDDAVSKAPALADELAWCAIWNAVKRETLHTHKNLKPNSDEFLKAVGERFTEVIVKTQVYDSTLARSANMRSKGALMNMWTAFMAEPTTSINMLQDAFSKGKRGKNTLRVLGAVYGSVILNSALVSLVYAMRDDDEDETFIEKYLSRFTTEVIDGVNPLTYFPFIKDIWSILQGFDVERADMSLITDVADSLQQLVKVISKDTSDMDEDELAEHRKAVTEAILSITDSLASLVGVPVKNVRRDVNGIINGFNTIKEDASGRETTAGSLGDNILEDVKDSVPVWGWFPDESKGDKLYDAIIKGDTAYVNRLKESYSSENAYNSAIRKALRENDPRIKEAAKARYNGDIAEYMRIAKEIIAEGHFKQDDVVSAINSEITAMKKGESTTASSSDKVESIYKMDDYYAALVGRDQATAYAVKEDLIKTDVANGKDRDEAEADFNSKFTSHIRERYEDGDISDYEARNMLVNYGGKSEESAFSKVQYWDFKKRYPDYDLSEEAVTKYYNDVEPSGIEVGVYYDYYKQRSKCKGTDSDGDGKTDSGSVKSEVLRVINSLPITSAQKDVLYYLNGWSAKTIWEAPWH